MRHEHKSSLATAFSRKGNVFEPKYACNSLLLAFREELPRGSGCHHVFPRLEHDHSDRAAGGGNGRVGACGAVGVAVDLDSQEAEALTNSRSHVGRVLADAGW